MLANKKPKTFSLSPNAGILGRNMHAKTSLFMYEKSSLTISNGRSLLGIQAVMVHCPMGRTVSL